MNKLLFAAIISLGIGSFTSISIMALYHIFLAIPIVVYLFKRDVNKKLSFSSWMLLGFCLSIAISVIFNQDDLNSFITIGKTKYYLIPVLSIIPLRHYFLTFLSETERKQVLTKIFYSFVISCIFATIVGLIHYFTDFHVTRFEYRYTERNRGMFGMLITYAHQSVLAASIFFGLHSIRKDVQLFKHIQRKLFYTAMSLNILGLTTTLTRGAIIALVANIQLLKKKYVAIIIGLGLVVIGLTTSLAPQFTKDNILRKSSNKVRLHQWEAATKAFIEKPLFGIGFRNFEPNSSKIKAKYNIPTAGFTGHAHNNFFEILSTTGLLGFITFSLWIVFWFWECFRSVNIYIKKCTIPFILTFLIGGLTQSTITDGENAFFIMFIYSISMIFKDQKTAYKV